MLDAKRAGFKAFAQHRVATHDDMFLNDHFVAPFVDAGVHLDALAIGGRAHELGVDLQQRCADDAGGFDQLTPSGHAALDEEVQRRGVHPLGIVGEEHDACGVAVTEHDFNFVNNGFAHGDFFLTWGQTQRAIQTNDFAIEVHIAHNVCGQLRKFFGLAQTRGEGDARRE